MREEVIKMSRGVRRGSNEKEEHEVIDELASKVEEALKPRHSRKGTKSHWRAAVVEAVRSAGDPDRLLAGWLQSGAHKCGLRPGGCRDLSKRRTQGCLVRGHSEFWAQAEPLANYTSVEEHWKLVRAEVARLTERGFCQRVPDTGRRHQAFRKSCHVKDGSCCEAAR